MYCESECDDGNFSVVDTVPSSAPGGHVVPGVELSVPLVQCMYSSSGVTSLGPDIVDF